MRICHAPQTLPQGFMTQASVEKYWARDRANLAQCKANLSGTVDFYDELKTQLSPPAK